LRTFRLFSFAGHHQFSLVEPAVFQATATGFAYMVASVFRILDEALTPCPSPKGRVRVAVTIFLLAGIALGGPGRESYFTLECLPLRVFADQSLTETVPAPKPLTRKEYSGTGLDMYSVSVYNYGTSGIIGGRQDESTIEGGADRKKQPFSPAMKGPHPYPGLMKTQQFGRVGDSKYIEICCAPMHVFFTPNPAEKRAKGRIEEPLQRNKTAGNKLTVSSAHPYPLPSCRVPQDGRGEFLSPGTLSERGVKRDLHPFSSVLRPFVN
jgi:hypothetical protein